MYAETTQAQPQTSSAAPGGATVCASCHAEMPREMRFCRACGFRLGEGVAEFTETVRFQRPPLSATQTRAGAAAPPPGTVPAAFAAANTPRAENPFGSINEWGALARDIGDKVSRNAARQLEKQRRKQERRNKPGRRSHWKLWLLLLIVISVVTSGSFVGSSGLRGLRQSLRELSGKSGAASSTRSWVGVNSFTTIEGGVTFDNVEPAGSPADRAGLVGGDIITTFDGHVVKDADSLSNLLAATPIGKTVDVVYIRDGETKTTKLTTISEAEKDRLEEAADETPDGYVGIGTDRDRVQVPGTKMYGVQLNGIRRNNPADIAGIRDGDIVIEFDGAPIRTDDELEARTRRAIPGSIVRVVVMRGSERLEIPVKVGAD